MGSAKARESQTQRGVHSALPGSGGEGMPKVPESSVSRGLQDGCLLLLPARLPLRAEKRGFCLGRPWCWPWSRPSPLLATRPS